MDVIGIGALNVDMFYEVPSLEVAGTQFEAGGEIMDDGTLFTRLSDTLSGMQPVARSGGGSAANTVVALARMGYSAGFLGVIGKDEEGSFVLSSMEGVDVSRIKRYQRTGLCVSLLSGGERSLMVMPNSNDLFSFMPEDIEYLNSSRVVHLSSFCSDSALRNQKQILELLDDDVFVSFAPGEKYARRGLKQIGDIIERCRFVFLNQREIGQLTSLSPIDGCKALVEKGARIVACTLGDQGSLIVTKNSEIRVPVKRALVVDTTGAGDVYAAGFLAGYLDGANLEACGSIASAAAALSLSSYGRRGYPDERFLRRFARELL